MKPFLQINEQLSLHLARPELAAPIFEVVDAQRNYLRQWLPWVDATQSVEDSRQYLKESMAHNAQGTQLITFLMEGETLAGSIGVVQYNKDCQKCEIGYWLRQDKQGRGLMTIACAAFTGYLFRSKDLNRIEILTAAGNAKSQAICQRLGFKHEGTLRQGLFMYGAYQDIKLYSLLRQEWRRLAT
ncbi:MAG: N-acetyltransferase [Saprospiraceae bacterium]|nr:MAG: N-acetyltransferase [Saprospiraceae bacterium]